MIFKLSPQDRPICTLLIYFIAWKFCLLLIAACSPGNAYDTSTSLIQYSDPIPATDQITLVLDFISQKLTRWDAIYFTTVARRGYLYEQEWAWGWGFTNLINIIATCLKYTNLGRYTFLQGLAGITIAHAFHGLSVLAIYSLTASLLPKCGNANKIAFVTACLHILSPAGLFLSAPYGESTFAFLSFAGNLVFTYAFGQGAELTVCQDLAIMLSGGILGLATTVRSNGILGGLIFLEEAFNATLALRKGVRFTVCRRLVAVGIGGVCVALGLIFPQYIAYLEYCADLPAHSKQQRRGWCNRTIPSVYAHVQEHYWNVGFLRYWTWSNTPLFALATPMLVILYFTTFSIIATGISTGKPGNIPKVDGQRTSIGYSQRCRGLLRNLAIQQLLLAVLALFNYHVQIITRISSGYPVWQIWFASNIIKSCASSGGEYPRWGLSDFIPKWRALIRFMLVYGIVQAGLFASFLPPA